MSEEYEWNGLQVRFDGGSGAGAGWQYHLGNHWRKSNHPMWVAIAAELDKLYPEATDE